MIIRGNTPRIQADKRILQLRDLNLSLKDIAFILNDEGYRTTWNTFFSSGVVKLRVNKAIAEGLFYPHQIMGKKQRIKNKILRFDLDVLRYIIQLRNEGKTLNDIAFILNTEKYKTIQGKSFTVNRVGYGIQIAKKIGL